MLELLDVLLTGGSFGIALLGTFACLRAGRATWSWAVTFAGIGAAVAWAWFGGMSGAGFVGLGLWLVFVGVPLSALRRSVRAIVVEDYADADRWARIAGWFHPSGALRIQRETTDLMRRLDEGDLDGALPRLREIHAAHPELDTFCAADEMRFRGDWEGVRAWMERELTEDQRRTEVRHVLPYLMSLAETGDAQALVDTYEASKPGLARMRGWGLHEMAQLVVATVCGLRDQVDALLGGPLERLEPPVQAMTRATLRMAEGEVDEGRAELTRLRDELNFANRLIVDRRLRLDPPHVSDALRERARALLTAPAQRSGRTIGKRIVQAIAVAFVLVMAVKVWAPWRSVGPETGDVEPLRFVERYVGTDDVDASLPLLVLLHGYGAGPEDLDALHMALKTPARVVLPAGPYAAGLGRSWFAFDDDGDDVEQRDESARRVLAFAEAIARDHPTRGRPVIGGFSQGAMLTTVIAARSPDALGAGFPIGGFLPDDVAPVDATERPVPLFVFHGEVDEIISVEAARDTVRRLRAAGHEVTLTTYPGLGHGIDRRLLEDFAAAADAVLAAEAAR